MTEVTVKALAPFTAFTGEMRVFNKDDVGPLPADIAKSYIDSGLAKPVAAKPQLDHDENGNAGGSKPKAKTAPKTKAPKNPALATARAAYKALFGKGPSPKWDVPAIEAKIAEKQAADAAEQQQSDAGNGDDASDAPPAE